MNRRVRAAVLAAALVASTLGVSAAASADTVQPDRGVTWSSGPGAVTQGVTWSSMPGATASTRGVTWS